MAFDTVIRNGTVVDGTGLAPYRADVGIVDGRIAEIGRIKEHGDRDLDADGPRRDARVHRRPHPHGRAGVLGSSSAPTRAGTVSRRW